MNPPKVRRFVIAALAAVLAAPEMAEATPLASPSPASASAAPEPMQGARQRGGRRRGGRRGGRGRAGRAGRNAPPAGINKPAAPAPPTTGPRGGELAGEEKSFRDLLDSVQAEIDLQLEEDAAVSSVPEAFEGLGLSNDWLELERPIFEACDRDASGWLSYRETREALEIDRTEFALYDRDRDGRIGSREFLVRYEQLVLEGGGFRLPNAPDAAARARPRTAAQLVTAFDRNGDRELDLAELGDVLADYGRGTLEAASVLAQLDADLSLRVAGHELEDLSRFVAAAAVLADDEGEGKKPKTVEELWGQSIPRESALDGATLPPRIAGPVSHFRRLDVDGNGFVTREDLRRLQGSAALEARTGAVLAALDLNEDGRVSEAEFLNSLRSPRK